MNIGMEYKKNKECKSGQKNDLPSDHTLIWQDKLQNWFAANFENCYFIYHKPIHTCTIVGLVQECDFCSNHKKGKNDWFSITGTNITHKIICRMCIEQKLKYFSVLSSNTTVTL